MNVYVDILFTLDNIFVFFLQNMASGQRNYGEKNRKQVLKKDKDQIEIFPLLRM